MSAHGIPSIADQHAQCEQWAGWLRGAGYLVLEGKTEDPEPFNRIWNVYSSEGWVAAFDIDGCGPSWHGPDKMWLATIGPHVGVTA